MFSIIIPTMQKNQKVLYMLLNELVADNLVGEIIIIDNSLSGINYNSDKIKVITPKENIYVNPAWNLGAEKAIYEYIGILNDDLIFPKNFFSQVFNFLISRKNIGYIGLDTIQKSKPECFEDYPPQTNLKFNNIASRNLCWGSAIFFLKKNYYKIPEEMKVWCGDDFLFWKSIKNKLENYAILNSNILHLHSLTSDLVEFKKIKHNDQLYYSEINPSYIFEQPKLSFWEKIFSIKNDYFEKTKKKIICILGIKLKFETNKKNKE